MALWRGGNVHHVRRSGAKHLTQFGKALRNAETFTKLLRHEQFQIAKRHNAAIRNPADSMHMLIGDFAAPDYGDAKHLLFRCQRIKDRGRFEASTRSSLPLD